MNPIMGHERGSVTILIALLSAVILTVGLSFNWLVREHMRTSEALRDKAEAIIKTRSAYDALIYIMLTGTLTAGSIIVNQGGITGLTSIPLNGTEVTLTDGVIVSAQDSNGRLSVTTVQQDALQRLVCNAADAERAALFMAGFLDWTDRDDLPRLNGAEAPYYRSQSVPFGPRNYEPQYLEELTFIRGVDTDLYRRIAPSLTILPTTGFNPNTAGEPVMKAFLGIDDFRAARIKTYAAKRAIKTMPELAALAGKMLLSTEQKGWFAPSTYIDMVVRTGMPRSLYQIRTGLTIGTGLFYPYFIHYWQEE